MEILEQSLFEKLPERSQIERLAKDGVIIAQRIYNGWTVTLYSLHGLFVEQWVGNSMQVFSTFKKSAKATSVLEPYLDDINLQEFIKYTV
jgi:hypothetical protein